MAVVDDSSITPVSPQRTVHADLGISISPILPTSDLTRHLSPPSPERRSPKKLGPLSPRAKLKRKVSKIRFKRKPNSDPPPVPTDEAFPLPLDEDEVPPFDPSHDSGELLTSEHSPTRTPDTASTDDVTQETSLMHPDACLDLSEYSDKVLGIKLLCTDPLKPHIYLSHPLLKVTLFNEKTCQYMKKSIKSRPVSSFYETDNEKVDYILPQLTAPAVVNTSNKFTPQWREELLFNEDLSYLLSDPYLVLLFELLEFKENSMPAASPRKGWKYIAWAFLKLASANTCVNLGKRLRLQLYCYLKSGDSCENRAFHSWYHGCRKKYPSTLHIITKALHMQVATPALRSYAPNQPETAPSRSVNSQHSDPSLLPLRKQPHWNRLSGQRCEIPDIPIFSCPLPHLGGSVVRFSPDGTYLAMALVLGKEGHIAVYSVPACEEVTKFKGHHGLIYDLSWSSTSLLISSASQDSTARIWTLSDPLTPPSCHKLLPHPSYVYAVCFHPGSDNILLTAGYDREIRVWGVGALGVNSSQILREFRSHEGYINCLALDPTGSRLFSGDSEGCVCMWQVSLSGSGAIGELDAWRELDRMELREIRGEVIRSLSVSGRKLLVHTRDGTVRLVDLKRHAVLQRYAPSCPPSTTHTLSRACVTPCQSHLYLGSGAELCVWELETANKLHTISLQELTLPPGEITCSDYHPFDHILALCTYGPNGSLLMSRYTPPHTLSETQLLEMPSLPLERPVSSISLADTAMLSLREKVRMKLHSTPAEVPSLDPEREWTRGSVLSSTWDSLGSLTLPPGHGAISPLMMEHNVITEEDIGGVGEEFERELRSEVTESYDKSELTIGMLHTPLRGVNNSTPVYSTSELEEEEERGRAPRSAARRRRTLNKQKSTNSPLRAITNESDATI